MTSNIWRKGFRPLRERGGRSACGAARLGESHPVKPAVATQDRDAAVCGLVGRTTQDPGGDRSDPRRWSRVRLAAADESAQASGAGEAAGRLQWWRRRIEARAPCDRQGPVPRAGMGGMELGAKRLRRTPSQPCRPAQDSLALPPQRIMAGWAGADWSLRALTHTVAADCGKELRSPPSDGRVTRLPSAPKQGGPGAPTR
jgi:hypothetical protein